MHVVLDDSGDLWSLSNRCLAAFRILQALRAETVWVRCRVFGPQIHKFFSAKTTRNESMGIAPNKPKYLTTGGEEREDWGARGDEELQPQKGPGKVSPAAKSR